MRCREHRRADLHSLPNQRPQDNLVKTKVHTCVQPLFRVCIVIVLIVLTGMQADRDQLPTRYQWYNHIRLNAARRGADQNIGAGDIIFRPNLSTSKPLRQNIDKIARLLPCATPMNAACCLFIWAELIALLFTVRISKSRASTPRPRQHRALTIPSRSTLCQAALGLSGDRSILSRLLTPLF
jgi:hypothetical protein